MDTFVDPRDNPPPLPHARPARLTSDPSEVAALGALCRDGRLYDVERWIRAGKPLQLASDVEQRRARASPLEVALEAKNQALVLLLLCNGYDPNLELDSPLDLALAARRRDLLDLLLEWGTDPKRVDLETLFASYDSKLFARFRAMGVDLTRDHEMARTLGEHTSNKPLFGFARRHRMDDPGFQRELDMALLLHTEDANEKGVHLCLWAGADPHAEVPNLHYMGRAWYASGDEEDEPSYGETAIHAACTQDRSELLALLGPDPAIDDFSDLYRAADSRRVIQALAQIQPPKADDSAPLLWHLWRATARFQEWGATWTLAALFEHGVRWHNASKDEIAHVRQSLVRATDSVFLDVMKLLASGDNCTPEIRLELARTPAMRSRMRQVGFIPREPSESGGYPYPRPTRSPEVLRKFGVELPKPAPRPLPRTVRIGSRRQGAEQLRMTRAELFERVWSVPVSVLCRDWGLSGPGLAKVCRRLKIPVPPRGYWARKGAGKRMPRRPSLPALPAGQVEEIIIWTPTPANDGNV